MSNASRRSLFYQQLPNSLLLALSDGLVLFTALVFGNLLIYWFLGVPVSIKYSAMIIPAWWVGAAVAGLLPGWGLGEVEEVRRIEISLLVLFTLAAVVYFFSRERVLPSRIVYMASWGFSSVAMPVARWAVRSLLIWAGRWGCPVAIYGRRGPVSELIGALQKSPELGYSPAAVFTDGEDSVCGVPVAGDVSAIPQNMAVAAVSLSSFSSQEIKRLIDHTLAGVRKVILFPDVHEGIFMSVRSRGFGAIIGLEVASNLLNPFARLCKRTLELAAVLITAPVWVSLCVVLIPLIWFTDGALPFYSQARFGKNGRPFEMIKFRTMVPDAERQLEAALNGDPALREEWNLHFKLKKDPRITPLGRFLRRFSLDELPQLINILLGQMSLVGPRPLPVYHHEALSDSARVPRNRVRPGLTGLWQITGRSEMDVSEMEQWDAYYVRNWSVWLDAVILARTFVSVISAKGAC